MEVLASEFASNLRWRRNEKAARLVVRSRERRMSGVRLYGEEPREEGEPLLQKLDLAAPL